MSGTKIKSLAKDTAIYGLSSIIGRFLNWLLVPFYTFVFTEVELGTSQNIYAYVAITIVILTFGMETSFFRYINQETDKESRVKIYSTILIFICSISSLFLILFSIFLKPIAHTLHYEDHASYLMIMAITVAFDAFISIPFAYLRYQKRPIRFASLKLLHIFLCIAFNLFFLVLCPVIMKSSYSELVSWFYDDSYKVGYTFWANMIPSILLVFILFPELCGFPYRFDWKIFPKMLKYAFPLVILGIVGIMNQTIDKILYPSFIFANKDEGLYWLGIYSAGTKVAVVMTMFTQAFRFAYEPFVFASKKDKDSKELYSKSMTYFVLFTLLIFLSISFYLELLKYIIAPKFFGGLEVVPLVMIGELFFGIYFNLSIWFKLTDKTIYGAYFSLIGCIIIVAINLIFVPIYGIIASAWANLACYFVMSALSYLLGQKYYPINYQFKKLALYGLACFVIYQIGFLPEIDNQILRLLYKTTLLCIFLAFIVKIEVPLKNIPLISKYLNRGKNK